MKPDFIGIGAQKCATAWLYNILSEHPQISLAMPRDFDKDIRFFSYYFDRGFEWYERHFEKCDTDIVGEFSTSYFYSTDAPKRIADYATHVKLLVSLRHPVERAFSNHKHEITHRNISGKNLVFENALENNPLYLEQSLYYKHLSRWLKYFSKKQILVILLDDIENDSRQVVRKLYEFLGVASNYNPSVLNRLVHETRIPENPFIESSVKRMTKLAKMIGLKKVINYLKAKGIKRLIDNANAKDTAQPFPPMEDKTRAYLLDYFREENSKLSDLIGRDLSMWNH